MRPFLLLSFVLFLTLGFSITSCVKQHNNATWLTGSTNERFAKVADQLGGFSHTMVEVGYRYVELYWAGQDQNWKFAEHQVEHIREAIDAGLERRPSRATSAQKIYPALDQMEAAIKNQNPEAFSKSFKHLRQTCNACHKAENFDFAYIGIPQVRLYPVFSRPQ